MFKNQIVVLVKKDGQPLRETDGKFIYLPFNSEYSLELKNQSFKRAVASIKIDGTDVLGMDEIILPSYGTVNVERFITNGDLSKGKKFKFVPLSNSKVQDPASPENGLVEIEVWFEKQPDEIKIWYSPPRPYITYPWDSGSWTYSHGTNFCGQQTNSIKRQSSAPMSAMYCSANIITDSVSQNVGVNQVGATVEGERSSQSFSRGYFGQKEYPSTTFKFWLRGVEQEVTTVDKLYCTSCGKKSRFDYKFCPRCGAPMQIA
jgi:hypothetical protein